MTQKMKQYMTMNMKYSKIYALLLAAMVTAGVATTQDAAAQVTIKGNVFGGGNAADVKVNTIVNIGGGTVNGNVYGGGKIGSVGTFAYYTGDDINASNYISSCADGTGTATVNIIGGTVGNEDEYTYDANNTLKHTSGGNVFAGSKGKLEEEGSTAANPLYVADWYKYARVKNTVLTVSGGIIKSNVYGGGELGIVGFGTSYGDSKTTDIRISGGTIGTEIQSGSGSEAATQYTFGSVFGAGYGSDLETTTGTTDSNAPKLYAGRVYGNTSVTMTDGTVKASVYGGGELASVSGNATVAVSGGTIGKDKVGDKRFGGPTMGNVYGGGSGNKNIVRAGQVYGNATVNISQDEGKTTKIYHNIYGGGAYGSVGTYIYTYTTDDPNYSGIAKVNGINSCTAGTGTATVTITGGTIGTDGIENGMIFGSSRGDVGAPGSRDDLVAWVNTASVTIGAASTTGPTIKGSVYGSGENGHTLGNATVAVHSGKIGIDSGADVTVGTTTYEAYNYPYRGNVYGGGCGTDKYYSNTEGVTNPYDGNGDKYNPKAGIVQGTATVNITGGHVVHNVYGAGAMGSVGTADVATSGKTTVTISGGRIGVDGNGNGNVFGAARGEYGTSTDLSKNLANVRETEVNISYTTTPTGDNDDKDVQLIAGSVFGGGESGTVKESVAVNMTGGLILKDIYGGGALADTQTSNWDASANSGAGGWADADRKSTLYTTTVRLTGGTILGEAYGGALGQKTGVNDATSDIEAFVYGDVLLDLNGTTSIDDNTHKPSATGSASANTSRGCVVDQIFGCNNVNGSPKGDVMVHIYGTQNKLTTTIGQKFIREKDSDTTKGENEGNAAYVTRLKGILSGKIALAEALSITVSQANKDLCTAENPAVTDLTTAITDLTTSINAKTADEINGVRYDVEAVYGGGNMAAYVPVTPYKPTVAPTGAKTQVIIEGCSLTSIETVYGGGNAAAVPETNVDIKGAYEIGYLFGGGNGKDNLPNGDPNPGADIGQYNNGTTTVTYGTGNANSLMEGGLIHEAYGGSNTKGVLKGSINQTTDPKEPTDPDYCCDLVYDKIVGAGKYADIDGDVNMTLSCQPSTKVPLLFAGADEANVNGNITLNITNGHFGKVFGGNNLGGAVKGKITVNVEETGCQPIKIDELYLGGYEATYSKFGYYIETNKTKDNGTGIGDMANDETAEQDNNGRFIFKPRTSATDSRKAVKTYNRNNNTWTVYTGAENDAAPTYDNPVLNITSCTYIGKVFGGGFGEPAKMYADPTVNVNMEPGLYDDDIPTFMNSLGLDVTKTAPNPDKIGIIGDVFGGGNEADIVGSTTVNIATVSGKSAYIIGSVFGGGNDADVLGNTNVTMSGGYVFNGIFGGGYAGNVGTFTEKSYTEKTYAGDIEFNHSTHTCIGKPTECKPGTGKCTVLVDGGQIGPISVATQGEGMNADGGPVPQGWVWGGGQGLIEDPGVHHDTHFKSYVGSTDVTIGGTALIMESVIGGGEFGRVLNDTKVTITGGQIGIGEGMVDEDGQPIRYTDAQFVNPLETTITSGQNGNALAACSHFPYGNSSNTYLPYDPYYDKYYAKNSSIATSDLAPASTASPSDGKTWIGCVFAGGSGYMPYEKEDGTGYDWCSSAGLVEGNTELIISGGHILTNVYGGNEVTNVKGKCKVKMTGGTIGVPRTVEQILAHPVICNLFGAGKGDQRKHFNKETNVEDVEVIVEGGIIYGSVFGGGEDGHVLRDVSVTIEKGENFTIGTTTYKDGPIIGTWGTSYMDGNVFGGGRGFGGDAYTAGNVAGSVDLKIKGGTILGSVYGGGRLGSVGYGLYDATTNGKPTPGYGEMRDDTKYDDGTDGSAYFTHKRGHIDITISGGTIGNNWEYKNVPTNVNNLATWKSTNHVPNTEYETTTETIVDNSTTPSATTTLYHHRLKHTKGGNVFAGGMGRLYQLDGTTTITDIDWWKLGCVKSTKLTITGGTIKSNVYGGGEMGQVVGYHSTKNAANDNINAGTEIIIQGNGTTTPTIGTEIQSGSGSEATTQYTFGSVFGGGYGSLQEGTINNQYPKLIAGLVKKDTKIDMQNGVVKASVYGGGEMASVGESTTSGQTTTATGSTYVAVSGGTVGIAPITVSGTKRYFGGAKMGNVYGGGSGHGNTVRSGKIFKNTNVTISGGTIYHNIYGGGAYGTVGDFNYTTDNDNKVNGVNSLATSGTGVATVTITGGTIGYDGKENGMVFGSSRGDINAPNERDDHTAWVYDTHVTIGETNGSTNTPLIMGSIYGSGENGHTFNDAAVTVYSGTIGVHDGTNADATRGNVYGGGCGTDKYYSGSIPPGRRYNDGNGDSYNPLAGIVYGNATVNITGGHVLHNVYGAGAMGSVGKTNTNGAITSGGTTTIEISGGTIGYDGSDNGNVYGAARGNVNSTQTGIAQVQTTGVTISGSADVKGSVFGGGEAGIVLGAVTVNMTGGDVLNDVYGGGALANTNTANWGTTTWADTNKKSSVYTTAVNLTGGTITGNIYGGGLGKMAVGTEPSIEAKVYGNTTVELNNGVADDAKGCIVKGSIFGCNNMSGSPQGTTTVHIYKTQRDGADRITNADAIGEQGQEGYKDAVTNAKVKGSKTDKGEFIPSSFDVKAVYGGGNLAAYEPVATITTGTDAEKEASKPAATVIIDGCDRTSICHVYGGGNAASTPATSVTINGTYEIGELFGGGNGKDDIVKNNVTLPNPGANVGYKDYSEYYPDGTTQKVRDKSDADTKANRIANYQYGSGVATVNVFGGLVHRVFGGSNTKGNVRKTALTLLEEKTESGVVCCDFKVDEAYGGGKSAAMDADARLLMACIPGLEAVYGGAEAADVQGGVILNITNGTFDRVFGGNNLSGTINGSIEVNIEETGCRPIIIGELYGGGNEAGYSVYGYNGVDANGKAILNESGDNPWNDPVVNVKSFTSIGDIFGGGYGSTATMVGNPTVNVSVASNPTSDAQTKSYKETNPTTQQEVTKYYSDYAGETKTIAGHSVTLPPHVKGKMGVVNNVFGGGNAAQVKGNTQVNIGTTSKVYMVVSQELIVGTTDVSNFYTRNGSNYTKCATGSKAADGVTYYQEYDVLGADIRGNVYGGGNNAEVTGNTNVVIGKQAE